MNLTRQWRHRGDLRGKEIHEMAPSSYPLFQRSLDHYMQVADLVFLPLMDILN